MIHTTKKITIPEELYKKFLETYKSKETLLVKNEDMFNKNRALNHKTKLRQKLQKEIDETPQKVQIVVEPTSGAKKIDDIDIKKENIIKEEISEKHDSFLHEDEYDVLFDKYLNQLIENRHTYGITENLQILSEDAKIIKNSNVKNTIEYLLDENNFERAPAGTKLIKDKILNDTEFKRLKELYLNSMNDTVTSSLNNSTLNKGKSTLFNLW